MKWGQRIPAILGRLLRPRGRRAAADPRAEPRVEPRMGQRVIRPWREDAVRTYPTVALTPSRLRALLQAADAGEPGGMFELFGEMLQKWPRLAAVAATRRLALTGLEWELRAGDDSPLAREAAAWAEASLRQSVGWAEALEHLAGAFGHGLAVVELVWERGVLRELVPAPCGRLHFDPREPWRLRLRTAAEPVRGVALDAQPNKWIVHQPYRLQEGLPGAGLLGAGLLRQSVGLFAAQHLSFRDWLIFSQVAGMPARIGQFEPGLPVEEQEALLRMLERLSTDAVAVLRKGVEIKLLEARGTAQPYVELQAHCNREVTILWLGQHLTTDMGPNGSRAAAEVHDRVREDLLVADMAAEARTIERDVLGPLTLARFGAGVTPPRFRRALVQSVDTRQLAETLAVAVERLGLPVSAAWVHEALGIPPPRAGEAILPGGTGQPGNPGQTGPSGRTGPGRAGGRVGAATPAGGGAA